tara:strand:- start:3590 stop:4468 length:879 start_codon:yes stop_codon:yes gene_type:complete
MKILITGSESFVGYYLKKELLKKKIKFKGIDKVQSKKVIKLDISKINTNKLKFKGYDAIVHLAAVSSTKDFKKNPDKAFKINLNGTYNIIRLAKKNNIKKIIFASSEWVYGEMSKKKIYENQPIDVSKLGSEYAFSKLAGENIVKFYCNLFNIKYVILRFGIVYGPRINKNNWSAVESLAFKIFKNENELTIGSKKTARRFVYVKDVAKGIVNSFKATTNNIFNLSGDKLITLDEIIKNSNKISGKKTKIIEKEKKNYNFRDTANSKIKKILKWKETYSFNNGLKEIINSFK